LQETKRFRRSLLAGTELFGLFTRLGDPEAVEALAASALDFVILDVEHGSLGRPEINRMAAAARAGDLPLLVRVTGGNEAEIHHALAVGATGVVVPHVRSGQEASAIADFTRTAAFERTYAGMGRSTDFRRTGWGSWEQAAGDEFVLVAQIDDAAGAGAAQDIAGAEGIDAVFVGSLSLALSLERAAAAAAPEQVIAGICASCVAAQRRIGVHVLDTAARRRWSAQGASLFVVGNDLNLLRQGADRAVALMREEALAPGPDRTTDRASEGKR
jgi:2-keto-3-deoxy-L-rhamnonate aldolase RhmA